MSGAEADVSSDGESSFEDEDVPLPASPLRLGTADPFEVVLKGGKPWGFSLGSETRSPVRISQILSVGVAAGCGQLQVGDIVLQVNDVRCSNTEEATQLIDSAFKTLALQVWRGTSEASTSPVRSASFLQKTRELSERARQAAVQDDSALFTQSKSASASKMKPRQRRIESFHGGNRRHSAQASGSSKTPHLPHPLPSPRDSTPTSTDTDSATASDAAAAAAASAARTALKGWATEHDLSSSRQPVIMSGKHGTVASSRHMPLTPAKSTSNLNQDKQRTSADGYSTRPPLSLSTAKSTPDIADHVNFDGVTSPTSPKSPSWYQQKLTNRSAVFDFSSAPPPRRTTGSPRHSYASGSPRSSYAGGSPRNSFSSYSSGYPSSSVTGFSPMSVPTSTVLSHTSMMDQSSQRSSSNYVQNPKLIGANMNSFDDTPNKPLTNKNYDRRSLPPQMSQFRQDSHKESISSAGIKTDTPRTLTSMPVTREEEELDKELADMKPKEPNDLDLRTVYSPPAPPVRDISSLKYVTMRQNHEKFPSWPVVTSQSPQNLGGPVVQGAPVSEKSGDKGSDSDKKSSDSDKSDKYEVQKSRTGEKSSPSGDRRSFEETKQNRNQSDPGFKQKPKKTFYTTRKALPPKTVPDYENMKSEEERFEEFRNQSKPGYPPPKFDPDGHNYGDEKYSIPSPPERDMPNLDEKTLVQKIAEVISPSSTYQTRTSYPALDSSRSHGVDTYASQGLAKSQAPYFHQALNSSNHTRLPFSQTKSTTDSGTSPYSQTKSTTDSGTSPLNSPSEEKNKLNFRTLTPNPRKESFLSPTDKSRGLIIRQMPYYNTSTQTDDNIGGQSKSDNKDNFENQSVLGGVMSQSTASSSVYHPSDVSSQSSGIGSMSFPDQHSAPMLRKLSEEFYRGRLSGSISGSEKRMSSSSTYEELKSPRSESSHYGGMREAESYNSVVIHAQEHAGPFGSDDFGSSPSLTSSRLDVQENEADPYKARRSIDSAMLLNKVSAGSMSMPPRSLHDSRFTSENNLTSGNYALGNHGYSQSLLHLNRPTSAMGEYNQHATAMFSHSSSSSSTSRPSGSMEARSSGSGSRLGSDSSAAGTAKTRPESDSVFYDKTSPGPGAVAPNQQAALENRGQSAGIGRKESMKLAYGTYDEHHYATPYSHQRNSSEVLSSTGTEPSNGHARSLSMNDYLPMHYNQNPTEVGTLDQITEEGSEVRWLEAVKKSRSLSRDVGNSDYANVTLTQGEVTWKNSDSDKSDTEVKKVKDSKAGMRRTVSEQIRPQKSKHQRGSYDIVASASTKDYSSSGESSKGNKSEGETSVKSMSQHFSESDLKRMQQKAVLDFVERKKKGSDSSDPQSPKTPESSTEFLSTEKTLMQPPSSPLEDITKRYNYTKAQRAESLRRTQSISSNSSKDSNMDYMDMRRLEQRSYHQTEWSRLRSMDGVGPKRPLSVGSDISGMEGYGTPGHSRDPSISHSRSASETGVKQVVSDSENAPPSGLSSSSNDKMVTSQVYQNYEQDYPRRPPPPVPGSSDDQPPALPPRSQRFANSKSESFLFAGLSAKEQDELKQNYLSTTGDKSENGTLRKDAYAEQLRRQARRLSEQPKAMPMQIVSTKSTLLFSMSQSYKQEPTPALEALPLHATAATTTVSTSMSVIPSETVSVLNHSPPNRGRHTPEPPPMPTPLKNGVTELDPDLNKTADFPPPPAEFIEGGEKMGDSPDRCADDSYGSYRSRAEPREVGKYKRTVSDSHVFKAPREQRPFTPDFGGKDVVETPNKPPRKKLELKGRDSPVQNLRSNSPSVHQELDHQSSQQMAPPHPVPAFHAAESSSVHHPEKAMAKPLQSLSVQNYAGGGNVVSTHVQRPAQPSEDPQQSVRDRVKKLEVYSHSPTSGKVVVQRLNEPSVHSSDQKREPSPQWRAPNSLENLENSVKGNQNLTDRLGPVVRKTENVNSNMNKFVQPPSPNERLHGDSVDKTDLSPPPQVPSRTYRQTESYSADRPPRPAAKPGETRESPYRSNSFQKRNLMHPQPYQSKTHSSVHPSNPSPPHPSGGSKQEPKRSPSQSIPEPQVPSRVGHHRKGLETSPDHNHQSFPVHDKTDSHISPEPKVVYSEKVAAQNKDSTQHPSVQTGQKRSYERSSFSKPRSYSASHPSSNHSPTSATSPDSNRSFNSNSNNPGHRPADNLYSRSYTHREPVSDKGDNSMELEKSRVKSPVNQTITYHSGDFKNWRKNQPEQQATPRNNNNQSKTDLSGSFIENENNLKNKPVNNSVDVTEKEPSNKLVNLSIHHGRQPSAEELECDVKAQELARVLPESDKKLSQVLQTDSNKSRMQYMDGLFPVGEELEADAQKRVRQPAERDDKEKKGDMEEKEKETEPTSPMPSNYYVSPPKAMIELELRKFGDTSQLCQGIGDNDTLAQKKEELLQSLEKKMALLRTDKKELLSDIEENENLGKQVMVAVETKCRSQQEKDKYKTYNEDIDKIIRLLLKLSGLLARAENTIQGLTENTNEKIKKMTYDKRDRLHKQHEDAKELKEDIDRRREQVEVILRDTLTNTEMDDYQYYIKMKSKYTIQSQELEDKITLGNEQIAALKKSIPAVQKTVKVETDSLS